MDERKQDAINESMLKALLNEQVDEQQIKREVHRTNENISTFETLANRIINDVQNAQTHRSVANGVLNNIGVKVTPKDKTHNPLRHVGQRARKVPLKTRKVRRVKRQSRAPLRTRHRPAVGQHPSQMSSRTL
jgi:hypothetical protein